MLKRKWKFVFEDESGYSHEIDDHVFVGTEDAAWKEGKRVAYLWEKKCSMLCTKIKLCSLGLADETKRTLTLEDGTIVDCGIKEFDAMKNAMKGEDSKKITKSVVDVLLSSETMMDSLVERMSVLMNNMDVIEESGRMGLNLDFSKCRTKEEVEAVFAETKKEIDTINQAKEKL